MTNVTRIRHALPVSPEITQAIHELEDGIRVAIAQAKNAGLPQGLLVSVLHGHACLQTKEMTE